MVKTMPKKVCPQPLLRLCVYGRYMCRSIAEKRLAEIHFCEAELKLLTLELERCCL